MVIFKKWKNGWFVEKRGYFHDWFSSVAIKSNIFFRKTEIAVDLYAKSVVVAFPSSLETRWFQEQFHGRNGDLRNLIYNKCYIIYKRLNDFDLNFDFN